MSDCSVVQTGLPVGYYDKDMQIEYALANLLLTYFDEELGGNLDCPYDWEEAITQWSRLVEIYNMLIISKKTHGEFFLDRSVMDKDQLTEILVDIVRYRGMLWS